MSDEDTFKAMDAVFSAAEVDPPGDCRGKFFYADGWYYPAGCGGCGRPLDVLALHEQARARGFHTSRTITCFGCGYESLLEGP